MGVRSRSTARPARPSEQDGTTTRGFEPDLAYLRVLFRALNVGDRCQRGLNKRLLTPLLLTPRTYQITALRDKPYTIASCDVVLIGFWVSKGLL